MPIDASIPLQVKPPEPIDPLAQYGKLFQLRNMQQQAQAGALNIQERTRAISDQDKLRAIYRDSWTTDANGVVTPDRNKLTSSLAQRGLGDKIPEITESLDRADKSTADVMKARAEADAATKNAIGSLMAGVRAAGYTPEAFQSAAAHVLQNKLAPPDQVQQYLAAAGNDPTRIQAITDKMIAESQKQTELDTSSTTAKARAAAAAKPTDATLAVDAQNPQSPTATASAAALDRLKPKPETSLQSENVLLDGKPAQITFNPKTGRRFDASGEDVTARTKPIPAASIQVTAGALDDVKESVQGMIDGTIPPQLPGRASKEYLAVMAEAHRQGYDLKGAVMDFTATQKHLATLNGAQQTRLRQSISTAAESLDVIDTLADQWNAARIVKDGKVVPLNKAELAAAKSGLYGQKAQSIATQLEGQITDVTSELGNVYMGGNSPTDHALKLAGKNLSADWSAQTLKDMTKLARTNLKIRNNSIVNSTAILSGGGEASAPGNIPEPVTAALKGAKAGRHTLSDGSVWDISATGAISKVK